MKRVLITGAKGMLGQDLSPVLEDEGCDVIETDIDNLDVTNKFLVESFFKTCSPDIVFHCAAYTDVEGCEDSQNYELAKIININGTENVAKVCSKIGAELVYISTDYVFDGQKKMPYIPSDKPNPLNKYGLTKLKGEELVQKNCVNSYIIRTSWLYGHYGDNFVEKMINISENRKEIKVVDDQRGCPTWTKDLIEAILEVLEEPYGIYHICGGGEASWYEFAKEILKDFDCKVVPCKTKDLKMKAVRPAYSVMDNEKRCRNWRLALKEYLCLRV